VKDTLISLLNLSEIDKQIHYILDQQREIPIINQELNFEINTLEEEINKLKGDVNEAETLKKDLSSSIQIKTEWIKDREEKINELKTQKEYQAAQKEMTAAKKEIKEKEAQLNELGPKLESLSTEFLTTSEKNEPKIEELKKIISENNTKLNSVSSSLDEQKQKKEEILATITDQNTLLHYNHILKRAVPALSKLDHGICTECGTRVLPKITNLLKVGQSIQYCPRCKRILYLEENLAAVNS